ncbi:MAG: SDR family NAD(P)-dependent oxidoreductase [Spirochaetaceae bacterium]|nr:MAG: SDR family NAD(P)-dependent oxidoreductase [Spirochaetaceae bacterium]
MDIRSLAGKLVYIFGGSTGIGLALADEFLQRGARIILFSRSGEKLKAALQFLGKKADTKDFPVMTIQLDVTLAAEIKSVLRQSLEKTGIPDIVINNVGRAKPGYFEDISTEQFDETIDVNLRSMWNTLQVLLPVMKNRGGYVVNVSSMVGFAGVFGYADYAASKFAVIGLTEVLRSEYLRHGIKFSVLCPPDTMTPGFNEENTTKPVETIIASAGVKAVSPAVVARSCLRGMQRERFIITSTFIANLVWFLKRHLPGLLFYIMDADIRKAQRKGGRKNT